MSLALSWNIGAPRVLKFCRLPMTYMQVHVYIYQSSGDSLSICICNRGIIICLGRLLSNPPGRFINSLSPGRNNNEPGLNMLESAQMEYAAMRRGGIHTFSPGGLVFSPGGVAFFNHILNKPSYIPYYTMDMIILPRQYDTRTVILPKLCSLTMTFRSVTSVPFVLTFSRYVGELLVVSPTERGIIQSKCNILFKPTWCVILRRSSSWLLQ